MALSPDVPTSIGPVMIAAVARRHPDLAWRFAEAHQKEIEARSDPSQVLALIPGLLASSSDAHMADQLHAFAQKAYETGGRRDSDKVEAEVRYRAMVRTSRLPELDRWLQLSQARAEPVEPAPETRPRRPRRP
jgi:aminopeptidase N